MSFLSKIVAFFKCNSSADEDLDQEVLSTEIVEEEPRIEVRSNNIIDINHPTPEDFLKELRSISVSKKHFEDSKSEMIIELKKLADRVKFG